jgi:hypothetical protein
MTTSFSLNLSKQIHIYWQIMPVSIRDASRQSNGQGGHPPDKYIANKLVNVL